MSNPHNYDLIINGLKDRLDSLRKGSDSYVEGTYPIIVETIYDGIVSPTDINSKNMPALFYGYGSARYNERILAPTSHVGETITLVVFSTVCPEDKPLIDCVADMHESIRMIVAASQNVGGVAKEARLQRVIPITFRAKGTGSGGVPKSFRALLECHIEVDHIYRKTGRR